ncbi:MmgE/PrpD family protein [Prauserella oleivorans]|uniref:MmgE/PrpD family protein n=1 Tax=Prauserella oleivorans TaxID=1478153 RepID=A0ABW5WAF3_9PSEU
MTAADAGPLDLLVKEAASLEFEHIPDDVVELARLCVLDVLGCCLAGASEPAAAILASVSDDDALRLGTAAHALDFDDWAPRSGAHPSTTIVPAILASLQRREDDCTGRDLIVAFVAGYELQERIGIAISPSHYDIGFHTTGVIGAFGAATASALLLGADATQLRTTLTIAATEAAGLKSVFGSMAKPLNAGRAAQAGVLAAQLATAGFVGPASDGVFGPQGFALTHASEVDLASVVVPFASEWTLRSHLFKAYPSCFGTHAAILGAESLRTTHDLSPSDIARIELTVPPITLPVCAIPAPQTGLEGKFSLAYCTAIAFEGDVTTASFADPLPASAETSRLMQAVELHTDEGFGKTRAKVEVVLSDGGRLTSDSDAGVPGSVSRQALERKFRDLTSDAIRPRTADRLLSDLRRLDSLESTHDVRQLAMAGTGELA